MRKEPAKVLVIQAPPVTLPAMPATAAAPRPSASRILSDLEALPFAKLERLMPRIAALRLKKHPQVMSKREEWLQRRIESGLPHALWTGYAQLVEKRRVRRLTTREQQRIEKLAEKIESYNAGWLRWAVELAGIRRMSLDHLVRSLGISRPADV